MAPLKIQKSYNFGLNSLQLVKRKFAPGQNSRKNQQGTAVIPVSAINWPPGMTVFHKSLIFIHLNTFMS